MGLSHKMGSTIVQSLQVCPVFRVRRPTSNSSVRPSEEVDLGVVERARNGDLNAFRTLVDTYEQRVFAIALGVVGNPEDARDITQEAFLKVFKKLDSFRGQSSFYTWLYRIVFNLSVDMSRKRYRTREVLSGDNLTLEKNILENDDVKSTVTASSEDPELSFSRSELRSRLTKAMGDLSPEHRTVITLREVDGLSYEEISQVVGCSKGTVMSRLHHARKRLQKALAGFSGNGAKQEKSDGGEGAALSQPQLNARVR